MKHIMYDMWFYFLWFNKTICIQTQRTQWILEAILNSLNNVSRGEQREGGVIIGKHILVLAECMRQRNEVAIKLGIIYLSLSLSSRHVLNLQERVVIGFQNFAWAPK
jgi:hypothetical protein